ncbi:hypothetical protein RJZ56_000875 [Blastomyces dermatitidis]
MFRTAPEVLDYPCFLQPRHSDAQNENGMRTSWAMKKRMGSWKEIESHALQRRACFTSLDFWDERDEDNDFDKGDDSANGRLFGKVSDIANTGRDATHMIWNVSWRQ